MKKNRFLKTAGALLILCLLTTCVIGTTFAKYITSGSTEDSARVARWGVQLELAANNELFENEYIGTDDKVTVRAATDVVAPGTKEKTAAVFSISGTPEVAVKITIDFTVNDDVFLKGGVGVEYDDYTTAVNTTDKFPLTEDYYPVVFTLKQIEDANGTTDVTIATGNLEAIKAALDAFNADTNKSYCPPNTNLKATFKLTWVWAFDGNDKADTYLANQDPGDKLADVYNTNISFDIEITVVQVD